jgi:hypothetical protein
VQALSIASRAGVTPGSGFKTAELINALADDLRADGYFDGTNGTIVVPSGRQVSSTGPSATRADGSSYLEFCNDRVSPEFQKSFGHHLCRCPKYDHRNQLKLG